ncbi:MAG: hypothetical protein NVS3B25_35060 [Hymenobacter sp.]
MNISELLVCLIMGFITALYSGGITMDGWSFTLDRPFTFIAMLLMLTGFSLWVCIGIHETLKP